MNKLPNVEGLLSYRSDDRKLYLKEKFQWEALATKKDVSLPRIQIVPKCKVRLNKMNCGVSCQISIRQNDIRIRLLVSCGRSLTWTCSFPFWYLYMF